MPHSRRKAPVEVVHDAVPGRVRFFVAALRGTAPLKDLVEAELPRHEGVRSASASSRTGSVLVLFEAVEAARIADFLEELVARFGPSQKPAPREVRSTFRWRPRMDIRGMGGAAAALARALRPRVTPLPLLPKAAPETPAQGWHTLEAGEVARILETMPDLGLPAETALRRLSEMGANRLASAPPRSGVRIFLEQLDNLPVLLLLGSAVLSVLTGGLGDAVVIVCVVILNAGIGCATEVKSERTITALTRVELPPAWVVRDGRTVRIGSEDLVPGDLLLLTRGSWVPADARLVETDRLTVDESALTGESLPVLKTAGALERPDLPLGDRTCLVYRGTVVTGGSGRALVVATGPWTEVGRIQSLVTETRAPQTPVQRQLEHLGRQMVILACSVSAGVFVVGLIRGYSLLELLKTTISLAVAAVPEGLPTVATTTLAWGVRRMRGENVLVRRLDAVETLGAVQVVCLDKTGTITTNRMTTVAACAGGRRWQAQGSRLVPLEGTEREGELRRLFEVAALCNEAEVEEDRFSGSPTEVALLRSAVAAGVDVPGLRARHPLVRTEHRSEGRMRMTTWHGLDGDRTLVAVKGRPDEVLALCTRQLDGEEARELTGADRLEVETENERMAGAALRVLGVAFREDGAGEPEGLTWLGLVGIADPVREGILDLVRRLQSAGIRTMMITGDQSATAFAIGRELGLSGGGELEILDSTRLEQIPPDVLSALVQRVHVFSRVDPSHKLQVVQSLQRAGLVVAMTGDGINDGPALRAADIGVAMGRDGAELAREVADVVLMEDDLFALISAVSQGRTIYDDIAKSVHFIAATNLSEILFMFASVAAGLGLPLGPKQLLWINLITDVFPELALAVEPPETDVLSRPPRDPSRPLISGTDFRRAGAEAGILTGATMASYLYGVSRYGPGPRAGTLAFFTLTGAQLLHGISSRSETHSAFEEGHLPPNRYMSWAVGGGFALEALAAVAAGVRHVLGTTPVTAGDAMVSLGCAGLSFAANELVKLGRARPGKKEDPS